MTLEERRIFVAVVIAIAVGCYILWALLDSYYARQLERAKREARHVQLWTRLCDALVSLGDKQSVAVKEAGKRLEEAYFGKRSTTTVSPESLGLPTGVGDVIYPYVPREPKRERRIAGLTDVMLEPGGAATMTMQPQNLFEILELHLESDRLADVVVDEIRCGKNSQFLNGRGGPGGHTCPAGYLSDRQGLKWENLQVSTTFAVIVRNVGKEPLVVRGALLGDALL